jgi:hypothetical protein
MANRCPAGDGGTRGRSRSVRARTCAGSCSRDRSRSVTCRTSRPGSCPKSRASCCYLPYSVSGVSWDLAGRVSCTNQGRSDQGAAPVQVALPAGKVGPAPTGQVGDCSIGLPERRQPLEPLRGGRPPATAHLHIQRDGGQPAGCHAVVIDRCEAFHPVPIAARVVRDAPKDAALDAGRAPDQTALLGQLGAVVEGGAGRGQVADIELNVSQKLQSLQLEEAVAGGGRAAEVEPTVDQDTGDPGEPLSVPQDLAVGRARRGGGSSG